MTKIVSVHSRKGGVGKTTMAYELAWLLGGVLVDLEWDDGSATRQWGYRHDRSVVTASRLWSPDTRCSVG
jgi:chromosome partitioning protein